LTKKFLKKSTLRDYLRVVATSKAVYSIVYYATSAAAPEETA
jgi:large subunit ribosomal protein L22e